MVRNGTEGKACGKEKGLSAIFHCQEYLGTIHPGDTREDFGPSENEGKRKSRKKARHLKSGAPQPH